MTFLLTLTKQSTVGKNAKLTGTMYEVLGRNVITILALLGGPISMNFTPLTQLCFRSLHNARKCVLTRAPAESFI